MFNPRPYTISGQVARTQNISRQNRSVSSSLGTLSLRASIHCCSESCLLDFFIVCNHPFSMQGVVYVEARLKHEPSHDKIDTRGLVKGEVSRGAVSL